MIHQPINIREFFEGRERDFLLSRVKVIIRSHLENIEAGEFKIVKAEPGEIIEVPRWAAEELVNLGLAEISEEAFEGEIFKALSREKILGPFQLSVLHPDFYLRMRRRVQQLQNGVKEGRVKREDYEKFRSNCYDLIGIRLAKLLSLSSTSANLSTISDKLTPEERVFFTLAQSISKDWRSTLLGEVV